MLIGYITLGTNDLDAASKFYDKLFEEINGKRIMEELEAQGFIVWASDMDSTGFAVCKPHNGKAATAGNGNMTALSAGSIEKVDAIYNTAIRLGGTCEGKPGDRGNGFYGAYFRDLDGNKLNAYYMAGE
ncbi:VOC family protein [Marinicella rhabdoformis]|uniref:VOC family protein n=1 Tax=Marinicella rhabdoformis TaxID=2580566 RepID=UPI0012AED861|nr:VOC family protein [Marinicella rhabdoformis]